MLQIIRKTVQLTIIFSIISITILSHYGSLATERRQQDFNHVLDETVAPFMKPVYKAIDRIISPPYNTKELIESLDLFKGGAWSINIFGFNLTDPLAALGAIIASHNIYMPLIAALAIPLLFMLIFGRAFCGWICPMNSLLEINDRIKGFLISLGVPLFNKNLSTSYKYLILSGGLLLAFSGFSVFPYILPYALISREIYYGIFYNTVSVGVIIIFFILLFEILISRRAWCRYFCPGGAFFSLIGSMRLVRVRRDSGKCMSDCSICDDACKQGLEPRNSKIGMECDNCGLCISKCPSGALKYAVSGQSVVSILLFSLLFTHHSSLITVSFAAHDNLINPHQAGVTGQFPQTASEDYIKEVDNYIVGFSAFQHPEKNSIRIKAVVTVKDKNGIPYHGPLTMRFIKDSFFEKSKEEIVRSFDSPVGHLYKHFDSIPYEGKFKVIVQFIPSAGGREIATEFPFTVGAPKHGRMTVMLISGIAVFSFGIVFYIKKKRAAQLPVRESGLAG